MCGRENREKLKTRTNRENREKIVNRTNFQKVKQNLIAVKFVKMAEF
jgi:hypothetical protein